MTLHKLKKERTLPRRHLIYYLRVFDRDSGELLGHVADITTEGLMLVSERPVEVHKTYRLRMNLPGNLFGREALEFEAQALWSNNDINPAFFDSGFRLKEMDHEAERCIEDLIQAYGFRD
jgi:hypothetical protein